MLVGGLLCAFGMFCVWAFDIMTPTEMEVFNQDRGKVTMLFLGFAIVTFGCGFIGNFTDKGKGD